jgi:hypothetical protein
MRPDPSFMGPDLDCSPGMSVLGQKEIRVMSALPPKAHMERQLVESHDGLEKNCQRFSRRELIFSFGGFDRQL